MKKQSTGAQESARVSLYFFATLLGSISPAKNTTTVVMIVLIDTALTPHFLVTARGDDRGRGDMYDIGADKQGC